MVFSNVKIWVPAFSFRVMVSWFLRPDSLLVWDDPEVRRRLSWYYSVMKRRRPPKFQIASSIYVGFDPEEPLEKLWRKHEEKSKEFDEVFEEVRDGVRREVRRVRPSFLDLKYAIVLKMLRSCTFCEWRCRLNREEGKFGVCRLDNVSRVSTYFLHWGEEAPLVPSGTIFFASCNSRCVFCQNWDISTDRNAGTPVEPEDLAGMMSLLERDGARNINFVGGEPTPNLHVVLGALTHSRARVPMLWNSNMYLSVEAMKLLREVIDIWLPDFKFGNDKCALRLSSLPRYFEVVSRNHKLISDWGADVIVRHLVLPNHVECCTKPVLEWIAENMPRALVNIMEQYRPEHLVLKHPEKYPDIARRPRYSEMEEAYSYARRLGLVYEPVS